MSDENKREEQLEKITNLPFLKVKLPPPSIEDAHRRANFKQLFMEKHGEYEVFCSICGDTTDQTPLFRVGENNYITSPILLLLSTIICKDCVTIQLRM